MHTTFFKGAVQTIILSAFAYYSGRAILNYLIETRSGNRLRRAHFVYTKTFDD